MKAIYYDEFGGPEVLKLGQVDEPHPGPGQVRIAVRTSGVNPRDHSIRNGYLAEVRPTTFPAIPGNEAAGVTDVAVGDEVLGVTLSGSYAEHALLEVFATKPAGLSSTQAPALPFAGTASRRDLDLLGITTDDTLLVHGAAGGVGTIAVHLAEARGATVIGTASVVDHDHHRGLGAIPGCGS